MTIEQRLERELPQLLGEIVMGPYPEYIDDVLSTTAHVRQRPGWTFLQRWFPMELVTARVPQARLPWRQIIVLAALAALLATMLVVYIGSQPTRLPAPFGPAANGVVAYSTAGDIAIADPGTGAETVLVTGPETDLGPIFSRDGTRFAFERKVLDGGGSAHVYVVGVDGKGLTRVTTEPLTIMSTGVGDPYQFSPDGRSLVIAAMRGVDGQALFLAAVDGSGDRPIDLSPIRDRVTIVTEPTFRPPDGREIMFVGSNGDSGDGGPGIYAVDTTTGTIRSIVEADATHALDLATWSPDGKRLSYVTWDSSPTANGLTVMTHIVGADGIDDRTLPLPEGGVWQVGAAWSNDGTRLHVVRGYTPGWEASRPAIVPPDGATPGTEVSFDGAIQGNCCYSWEWSPDDSLVIGRPIDANGMPLQQVVIDVATGSIRPAPWTTSEDSTFQRRAD